MSESNRLSRRKISSNRESISAQIAEWITQTLSYFVSLSLDTPTDDINVHLHHNRFTSSTNAFTSSSGTVSPTLHHHHNNTRDNTHRETTLTPIFSLSGFHEFPPRSTFPSLPMLTAVDDVLLATIPLAVGAKASVVGRRVVARRTSFILYLFLLQCLTVFRCVVLSDTADVCVRNQKISAVVTPNTKLCQLLFSTVKEYSTKTVFKLKFVAHIPRVLTSDKSKRAESVGRRRSLVVDHIITTDQRHSKGLRHYDNANTSMKTRIRIQDDSDGWSSVKIIERSDQRSQ